MAALRQAPLWINLGTCRPEAWVAGCHGMRLAASAPAAGEAFLFSSMRALADCRARPTCCTPRRLASPSRGAAPPGWPRGIAERPGCVAWCRCSPTSAELPALFDAWTGSGREMLVLVPESRVLGDVQRVLGRETPAGGRSVGARRAHRLRAALHRPGGLRRAAVGLRAEFRARRGLLRARAMGGATVRLADLSAGGCRPPRQARGFPGALPAEMPASRRMRSPASGAPGTVSAGSRDAGRGLARPRPACPRSMSMLAAGADARGAARSRDRARCILFPHRASARKSRAFFHDKPTESRRTIQETA